MGEARAEKVAVVDEVREKFSASDAAVLTEYRGLDVPAMAELRHALRQSGGEYKVYKNSLVRFAADELGLEIEDLLIGPTAIAFVGERADGSAGDPVGVAKALKEFAKVHETLIIKGGLLDDKRLTVEELSALAEIAPREVLLAQLAGAMAAPMQQFASLLNALPQNLAYALQALIEQGGASGEPSTDETEAADSPMEETAEDETDAAPAAGETEAADSPAEETAEDETDAAPAAGETEAADSPAEETAEDEGTDNGGAPVSQDDDEEEE
ncbi:MAG: 50S ribosomal protein L10 [Actinomycetota bacterium]|nr:50S ribosomal protein L10 [Actinomycetota bacterium]MEE3352774.1 50S ribosomal protein L10 [Actinomycetota bacterium]